MSKVGVADLKAKLSEHLRTVKRGEEVTVYDRNEPIARIVPFTPRGALIVREPTREYKSFRDIKLPPAVKLDVDPVELLLQDRNKER
ncbi:MAG: type II toxin-antitoxin system prevent-host-death family antitoxin [Gemmatimonadota bacterium]|nr:type II toxin-antitoxin system prevent-host-death family antitoxin [Gemmatimonadota bacterium]